MPLDSGRKKDPVWLKVDAIENDKNKCVCRACDQVISKKIERVKAHMENRNCNMYYKLLTRVVVIS